MTERQTELLRQLGEGQTSLETVLEELLGAPEHGRSGDSRLTGTTLDFGRQDRCGMPEVVFCEGKDPETCAAILNRLHQEHGLAFGTRCNEETWNVIETSVSGALYNPIGRTVRVGDGKSIDNDWPVAVVTAGTSDRPVAIEAEETLRTFGARPVVVDDVGVAGLHRIIDQRERLQECRVVIVVAGMEGALPSVVTGLTSRPVVAVPTSIGYGAAFKGLTALFAMLTGCASGATVVNIDNGFGAAAAAFRIMNAAEPKGGTHS